MHCDWHVNAIIKKILDELFGENNLNSEIIWKRSFAKINVDKKFPAIHETIFVYNKSENLIWNKTYTPYEKSYLDSFYSQIESPDRTEIRKLKLGEEAPLGWRRFGSDNLANPSLW